ncbi:hypothetical protein BMW23_0892 [Bodo saltans virus]|uniref:Uncharacterized protein n=1 Tax=Bodo saltans virus TaxID=2024608 RepID=A0A2H4UVP0_9VIRU|nr:hypothetical protein QJ851_gp0874 [Bodo saltans virus]ATZ80937.1 hypothetical protein BMW23_0892 [Bodo saltans virus]
MRNRNQPLMETQEFYINNNELLHNNVAKIVNGERISEYRIQINSKDRNVNAFPSPFDIKVAFGNANYLPNIEKNFKNVKYISLNSVILPRTVAIDTSETLPSVTGSNKGNLYPTSSLIVPSSLTSAKQSSSVMYNLEFRPYLILNIKELATCSNNAFGTSSLYDNNKFMLFPDRRLGDMYAWKPYRGIVIYPTSLLFNLSLMSLHLTDESGNNINIVDHNGNNIIGHNIDTSVPYDYNGYISTYPSNYYVNYTNTVTQVLYDFSIGVVENEINTLVNY